MPRDYQLRDVPLHRYTAESVREMYRHVAESVSDPEVIKEARHIASRVPARDNEAISKQILQHVKERVHYVRDPIGVETVGGTRWIRETGAGDCDEHVIYILALARAVGIPGRVVTLRVRSPEQDDHTYAELHVKGKGWMAADSTVRSSYLGWEPPRYFQKKVWSPQEAAMSGIGLGQIGRRRALGTRQIKRQVKKKVKKVLKRAEAKVERALQKKADVLPVAGQPGRTLYMPVSAPQWEQSPPPFIFETDRAMQEATYYPDLDAMLFPAPGQIGWEPGLGQVEVDVATPPGQLWAERERASRRRLTKQSIKRRIKSRLKEVGLSDPYWKPSWDVPPGVGEAIGQVRRAGAEVRAGAVAAAPTSREKLLPPEPRGKAWFIKFSRALRRQFARPTGREDIRVRAKMVVNKALAEKVGLVDEAGEGLTRRSEVIYGPIMVNTVEKVIPEQGKEIVVDLESFRAKRPQIQQIVADEAAARVQQEVAQGKVMPQQAATVATKVAGRLMREKVKGGTATAVVVHQADIMAPSQPDLYLPDAPPARPYPWMQFAGESFKDSYGAYGMGDMETVPAPGTKNSWWEGLIEAGTRIIEGSIPSERLEQQRRIAEAQRKAEEARARYEQAAATPGTGLFAAEQMKTILLIGGVGLLATALFLRGRRK